MANIIKLIKCDQNKFQSRINELRLVVEGVSVKMFFLVTATSLGCMAGQLIALGIISGIAAIMSLTAYGYSQSIAKFIVLYFEKRELLVLAMTPKQEPEVSNY